MVDRFISIYIYIISSKGISVRFHVCLEGRIGAEVAYESSTYNTLQRAGRANSAALLQHRAMRVLGPLGEVKSTAKRFRI